MIRELYFDKRCLPDINFLKGGVMDVNDPNSMAFQYLSYLNDASANGHYGAPVRELGRELGLTDNEIKDVIQCLRSNRMITLRASVRSLFSSAILPEFAVVSDQGVSHLRLIKTNQAATESEDGD